MPLDEIGAAHEGGMLSGAPVIVPQVEVLELNRQRIRRIGRDNPVCVKHRHNVLSGSHFFIGGGDNRSGFLKDALDSGRGVALLADVHHSGSGASSVLAWSRYFGEQIVGKAVRWVMCYPAAI